MMTTSTARIELPKKLIPVFKGEADVRWACGGRGSAKTRSFALMAAVEGYRFGMAGIKGLILCARQYMNSLEDSSLEELKRAIESVPWLKDYYEIGEKYIKSRDGNISFTFAGLDRNIASIKSKGRILLCWIDEAEPVTDQAFDILVPTLREEGEGWNAELWLSWNPARKAAAVERRYRFSNDPRIKGTVINWRDNPKFPDLLNRARLRDKEQRPDEYDHIWEGAYGTVAGAILGKHIAKARADGRIGSVEYDPNGAPIVISSDIGFRDTASWWFWQPVVGGFSLLKYDGDSGLDADDWADRVKENLAGMKLDTVYLPHDARAKTFQSKRSSLERFIQAFGAKHVRIVPQSKKLDQINAARAILPKCQFDLAGCEHGIDGLEGWRFEWNSDNQAFSKNPLHDHCSHPADAFCYGAQMLNEYKPKPLLEDAKYAIQGTNKGRIITAPLDTLWDDTPTKSRF